MTCSKSRERCLEGLYRGSLDPTLWKKDLRSSNNRTIRPGSPRVQLETRIPERMPHLLTENPSALRTRRLTRLLGLQRSAHSQATKKMTRAKNRTSLWIPTALMASTFCLGRNFRARCLQAETRRITASCSRIGTITARRSRKHC